MVRPTQPLGTFGKITVKRTRTGYVATTRFRELNGSYRRVTANGETATSAENRLKEKIAAGLPSQAEGDLNAQTKVRTVAEVWLKEIEQRQEHAPQTIEVYRDIVRRIILPGIGELRLGELTVGTLDRFLKAEAERGYSRGRHARVVLAQILDLAVRHDAMPRNPVRSTAPLRRSRSEIRSLTLEELAEIRRLLRSTARSPGSLDHHQMGSSLRSSSSCSVPRPVSAKRSRSGAATSIWTPSSRPSRSPGRSSTSAVRASSDSPTRNTRSTGAPSPSPASRSPPCESGWPRPASSTPARPCSTPSRAPR